MTVPPVVSLMLFIRVLPLSANALVAVARPKVEVEEDPSTESSNPYAPVRLNVKAAPFVDVFVRAIIPCSNTDTDDDPSPEAKAEAPRFVVTRKLNISFGGMLSRNVV